jgi:hypothetical protein
LTKNLIFDTIKLKVKENKEGAKMKKVAGQTMAEQMEKAKEIVSQGLNRHERRKQAALARKANEKLDMQRRDS